MHMFIVESLEVMFYKYQSAIQLDFKTRDIANKHLKFKGKVRTGDIKLDFCILIYWSKKGNIHLQTKEVSVRLETIQDKEFIYLYINLPTLIMCITLSVSCIIICVFIDAAPFHGFISLYFNYFLHSAEALPPLEILLWYSLDILLCSDSSVLCEFNGT